MIKDDQVFTKQVSSKGVGILLGVAGGIAVAIALSKAKEPYTEITDGPRSIRLRVGKDDLVRFESSLQGSIE